MTDFIQIWDLLQMAITKTENKVEVINWQDGYPNMALFKYIFHIQM